MEFNKAKVFTALNADEIKIGSKGYFADTLENLKDVVEHEHSGYYGKLVEIKNESYECRFSLNDNYNYSLFYLVEDRKEEFRPYKNTDEMVEDFMKRFNVNVPPYAMPLIWVKTKGADKKYLIVRFASALTICHNVEVYTPTLEDLVEGYTYLDGSPCGIEENEE